MDPRSGKGDDVIALSISRLHESQQDPPKLAEGNELRGTGYGHSATLLLECSGRKLSLTSLMARLFTRSN